MKKLIIITNGEGGADFNEFTEADIEKLKIDRCSDLLCNCDHCRIIRLFERRVGSELVFNDGFATAGYIVDTSY